MLVRGFFLLVWGVGVVFGNCIVDASILNACVADCFVVGCVCGNELWFVVIFFVCFCRCLRAFGGCLGMKGRRRTWRSALSLGESTSGL